MKSILLLAVATLTIASSCQKKIEKQEVGKLSVSFDNQKSTQSQYIACGSDGVTDASVANFLFQSEGSERLITELKFSVTDPGYTITSVKVAGVTAPVVGGIAFIVGLKIIIPASADVIIPAYISYSGVGIDASPSGITACIFLKNVKSVVDGVAYSDEYNIATPRMMLVGSKPTIKIAPPFVTQRLVPGYIEALAVEISADPHGDIELDHILFTSIISGGAFATTGANNFIVKDQNQVSVCNLGYFMDPSGGDAGVGFSFCGSVRYRIPAGTTKTFHIFVPIAKTNIGSYLITKLRPPENFDWVDVLGKHYLSNENILYLRNYPKDSVHIVN